MSAATSPGTGLAYGLRRVCVAWGMARSSFYAMTSGQHAEQPPAKRRGPKPAISDQALLVAIEADLEASPWEGEGYRKVWARLRVCRDIRVARKRVLRLMRENNLLSPHRCRRRGGNPHDGEIITHAPNLMWGTDGVRVFTVDDGWGWIFTAVEHWNAECVGWHVCKRGDRFAALQPISMGLAGLYGSTAAGAARGLALRMDHGSQYLSDHFTNQIKFWGIQPSYAFVAEPQTNGVAERFNRTLKEQIIHGRIYRNIAELRDAVRDFVELYNAQWIVEKNGYLSPAQARQAWHAAISIRRPPRETNLCPRNRVRYISCAAEVIARHPRSYEQEDFVFDPLHYLSLLEQKTNALDQAAPLAGWLLPPVFGDLRRLLEARMGKAGKREYVQVLRLIESFSLDDVRAAISEALERGVIGFDAVKHLVLCRIEKRPPRLNLLAHPYLPRAEVATTSARSYMGLLKGAAP